MKTRFLKVLLFLFMLLPALLQFSLPANAQGKTSGTNDLAFFIFLILLLLVLLVVAIVLSVKTKNLRNEYKKKKDIVKKEQFSKYLQNLDSNQIEIFLKHRKHKAKPGNKDTSSPGTGMQVLLLFLGVLFFSPALYAQNETGKPGYLLSEAGVIITLILIVTPILAGIVLMFFKIKNALKQQRNKQNLAEANELAEYLATQTDEETMAALEKRKGELDYQLSHSELAGQTAAVDEKGIISNAGTARGLTFVAIKKKAVKRPNIDPQLSKLVLWYIGTATFWLLFGTTIGEYLGIKFVAPDADHLSWLSFGRLRPVHTNAVFWGWASLAMLGLGYYIVPMVSNTKLASIKNGWYSLFLINASVIIGTICLMAGINNGGGEFREYVWPVMLLFGIGLVLTLINFLQTIARRKIWYRVGTYIN